MLGLLIHNTALGPTSYMGLAAGISSAHALVRAYVFWAPRSGHTSASIPLLGAGPWFFRAWFGSSSFGSPGQLVPSYVNSLVRCFYPGFVAWWRFLRSFLFLHFLFTGWLVLFLFFVYSLVDIFPQGSRKVFYRCVLLWIWLLFRPCLTTAIFIDLVNNSGHFQVDSIAVPETF